jgi:hypothetical protein
MIERADKPSRCGELKLSGDIDVAPSIARLFLLELDFITGAAVSEERKERANKQHSLTQSGKL